MSQFPRNEDRIFDQREHEALRLITEEDRPVQSAKVTFEMNVHTQAVKGKAVAGNPAESVAPRPSINTSHVLSFAAHGDNAIVTCVTELVGSVANLLGVDVNLSWSVRPNPAAIKQAQETDAQARSARSVLPDPELL